METYVDIVLLNIICSHFFLIKGSWWLHLKDCWTRCS